MTKAFVADRFFGMMMFAVVGAMTAATLGNDGQVVGVAASIAKPELIERTNAEFNLEKSAVVSLAVDPTPETSQRVALPLGENSYTLNLWPHSVRSEHYQVKYQLPDGTFTIVEPGPVRTVRGTVDEIDGALVAGSVMEDGFLGMIVMPDGDRWWVEPISDRVEGANIGDHVIYRDEDVIAANGMCGTDETLAMGQRIEGLPEGNGCNGSPCVAELACDSDVEYHNRWGNNVEARINSITNTMNMQYESEVGITHVISTIIVRPTEPDPYTSSTNTELLGQFQSHWLANQQDVVRDVAQLFTARAITCCPNGVIGTALTIGGICTTSAYCFVWSDFNNVFSCATDLSAHELGHLWGASHCACPGLTMNPSITCANQFGAPTTPSVIAHRNSRPCLSDSAPATTFPFMDSFATNMLDPTRWLAEGATVDDVGIGEPSPSLSMRINIDDRPSTGIMNASGLERVGVEYWWQRTGGGGSPEPIEDLVLEYLSPGGVFVEVDRQLGDPGNGGDGLPFAKSCVTLPANAAYDALQIRFRGIGLEASDDWFIDDVRVFDADEVLNIVTQPEFDCACLGGSAAFSVEAGGVGPFTYQWRRDNEIIPGATDSTLVISPILPSDFVSYSVDVSNDCGTLASVSVQLLETFAPEVNLQPQSTTVAPGETLGLFIFASGNCAQIQWYFNGDPIPGATNGFLFIPDMQCVNQGCYHAVASNDCGMVASDIAEVTVTGCAPLSCNADSVAPVVVHASGLAGQTRPYTGYIDPRRESTNGVNLNAGITQVDIRFSEPVAHVGGGALAADSFVVTQTGAVAPPTVVSVNDSAMPMVTVTLSRPITLQEWTTIQAVVQDLAESPNMIVNVGDLGPGVDESDRVDIGFLPANVDQNNSVNPLDLLRFKQLSNGLNPPPLGTVADFIDIDRSGGVTPLDLLAFKRLINGVNPATQTWNGKTMSHARP